MVRIIFLLILLLSLGFSQDYAKDRIIIKLKSPQYSVYTLGTQALTTALPSSVQKLNQANQVASIRAIVDPATKITPWTFATLQDQRTYSARVQEADKKNGLDLIYVIQFTNPVDVPFILAQYQNDDSLEYAEPDYILRLFNTVPDDSLYPTQATDCYNNMAAEKGWDITTGSATVIIAIIDTGVSLNHEDLAANLWTHPITGFNGYDFYNKDDVPTDDNNYGYDKNGVTINAFGHGTQCAGHAAAVGNNAKGVCGVSWKSRIMALKLFDASGTIAYVSDAIAAVNYAKNNGAKVINMSFGGTSYSSSFDSACASAYSAGVILVASMGNDGDGTINYPAKFESVIGVGAVDSGDNLASFSSYGSGTKTTELVAPGVTVLSTCAFTQSLIGGFSTNGKYNAASGTSFSSPKVAGLCALMFAAHPELTNAQIRIALHNSADDLGDTGYDAKYGYGRINIYQALSLISTYTSSNPADLKDVYNFPNPVTGQETKFCFRTTKNIKKAAWTVYDLKGREVVKLEAGPGMSGYYQSKSWNCTDINGNKLANGTYIFVLKVTDGNDLIAYAKGKMSIVN